MRRHIDALTHDLTREAVIWQPPGAASTIGATLLHIRAGEDRLIQDQLQGRSVLWATGQWAARVRKRELPVRGHDWQGLDLSDLHPDALRAYAAAVAEATLAWIARLTDADLESVVTIYGSEQSLAEALLSIVIHNVSHAGEIVALKGLQGVVGRPT